MKASQAPETSTVRQPSAARRNESAQTIRWGNYELSEQTLSNFRAILEADLGSQQWTKDEIRQMAYDSVLVVLALVSKPINH